MAWSSPHWHHTVGENQETVTALQSGWGVLVGAGVIERGVVVGVAVLVGVAVRVGLVTRVGVAVRVGASSVSRVAMSVKGVRVYTVNKHEDASVVVWVIGAVEFAEAVAVSIESSVTSVARSVKGVRE